MKTEIPMSLKSMQNEDKIGTRYTKKPWGQDEYVWFNGYAWEGTSGRSVDQSDSWIRWTERAKVVLWLNVYPKSVQTGETKRQVDSIATEGRVARVRLEVEKGRMDE